MQICVYFYESKNKQTSWFTKKVEHRYWEHWYVNLNVAHHPKPDSGKSRNSKVVHPEGTNLSLFLWFYWYKFSSFYISEERNFHFCLSIITESAPDEREARHSGLELSLREVLFQIINFVKEKKDHIPSIENLEGDSFPFEITISR